MKQKLVSSGTFIQVYYYRFSINTFVIQINILITLKFKIIELYCHYISEK